MFYNVFCASYYTKEILSADRTVGRDAELEVTLLQSRFVLPYRDESGLDFGKGTIGDEDIVVCVFSVVVFPLKVVLNKVVIFNVTAISYI